MCGLLGLTFADERKAAATLERLAHRGPDGRATWGDDRVSLGHARLAILDLTDAASQPMVSASGNTVIVFNGEIYNCGQLRAELVALGFHFKSTGDTEVILYGYEAYGTAVFSRLRGMWALAIYDRARSRLVLSRDYFSIKPLCYAVEGGRLYFASEIKALLALLPTAPTPDADEYFQFFSLGYFVQPATGFKNIHQVLGGEILIWDLLRKSLSREHAKLLPETMSPHYAETFSEAVALAEETLIDTVKAHYLSDVPVGLLLSGGTDSALLAALSVAQGKRPLVYNLNIQNSTDAFYAKKISRHLGLELVMAEMSEPDLEAQYERIWEFVDEPMADYSIIPTSLIYSCIKGKAKVVLSGEGGDELSGGYVRHSWLANFTAVKPRNTFLEFFAHLGAGITPVQLRHFNPLVSRLRNQLLTWGSGDLIGAYLIATKNMDYPYAEDKLRALLYRRYQEFAEPLLRQPAGLFFDRFVYLPNDLMYKNDIASMASSIEARVPLLDKSLYATLARCIKPEFCLSPRYRGKALLKAVLTKYLPPELVERPKKGFSFSFTRYAFPAFRADFKKALDFHQTQADAFGLSGSPLLKILTKPNAECLITKYPNLAFAVVSNWKIWQRWL